MKNNMTLRNAKKELNETLRMFGEKIIGFEIEAIEFTVVNGFYFKLHAYVEGSNGEKFTYTYYIMNVEKNNEKEAIAYMKSVLRNLRKTYNHEQDGWAVVYGDDVRHPHFEESVQEEKNVAVASEVAEEKNNNSGVEKMPKLTKEQLSENLGQLEALIISKESKEAVKAIMISQLENKMDMLEFFPSEVTEKIKNTLKAYDRVNVTFEYGRYHVSTGIMVKASYGSDKTEFGEYHVDEIFTQEEKILNYMEAFHGYHAQYQGERDYKMLASIEGKWNTKFKYDEKGNIVIA